MDRIYFVLTLALGACSGQTEPPPDHLLGDGDADADVDGDADGDADPPREPTPGTVDLLFVIDNSGSMAEEQENLVVNFPSLVDALVAPPDRDGDGQPDAPAVTDLHVGVITTDVGVGGNAVPTCGAAGDDGIMVTAPRVADPSCHAGGDPTLSGPSATLAEDFACRARVGTNGCGIEQPFEAVRRALVDHGTTDNAGFLRDDSVLAIVFVTDEDDCTVQDDRLFTAPEEELGVLNTRCYAHDELLQAPELLAAQLHALRPGLEHSIVVGAIAGTPVDWDGSVDSLPSAVDPVDPSQLRPSCTADGLGSAMPPRRLARLADAVSDTEEFTSICQADWRAGFEALAARIGEGL